MSSRRCLWKTKGWIGLVLGLVLAGQSDSASAQCSPQLPPPPDDGVVLLSYSLNGQTVSANASGSFLISNVAAPDVAPADFVGDDYLFLTAVKITSQETTYAFGQIPFQITPGGRFVFETGKQVFSDFTTTPPVLPESITLTTVGNSIITPLAADGQCQNTVPCSVPLQTIAKQSDGSQLDVTLPSMWTTYRTSNASIARIVGDNADLNQATTIDIEGVSPGVAFITATNGGATSVVKITVANPGNLISTAVEGFVRRMDPASTSGTSPVSGASVTVQLPTTGQNGEPILQQIGSGVSNATGFFSINPVTLPDTATEIFVDATITINSITESGSSISLTPVPGGITDAGIITMDIVCDTPWSTAFGPTTLEGTDINAFAIFDDDGSGPNPPSLFVGGKFSSAGGTTANNIAKWNGRNWEPLVDSVTGANGVNEVVNGLAVVDLQDGNGPGLYVAGGFVIAGGMGANKIARWDGTNWSQVGDGVGTSEQTAFAVAGFDEGTGGGVELYVGGDFQKAGGVDQQNNCLSGSTCVTSPGIAKWNPTTGAWLAVGGGTNVGGSVADGTTCGSTGGGIAGSTQGYVAKWDAPEWSVLGNGLNDEVQAVVVHDDGSGTALFAGGSFTPPKGPCDLNAPPFPTNAIAKFDGVKWSSIGTGMSGCAGTGCAASVHALAVFDEDGPNLNTPRLFAGGDFTFAGGIPANNVARWDGSSWSAVGNIGGVVEALAVFDTDGPGMNNPPALYAAGSFAGGTKMWNGTAWTTLGSGIASGGLVFALAVFDDGSGPKLYVGGNFTDAGGVAGTANLARWDGSAWSAVGSGTPGVTGAVYALTVFDDGTGPALYVGGEFLATGGMTVNRIAQWDGTNWSALNNGVGPSSAGVIRVDTLLGYDDGSGPILFVGGDFQTAGGTTDSGGACVSGSGCIPVNRLAKWSPAGNTWLPVGVSSQMGSDPAGGVDLCTGSGCTVRVNALSVFDDGATGSALFVAGQFNTATGVPSANIAKLGCR